MCLAIPARVKERLGDDMAKVDLDGVLKDISIALTPDVVEGDYVIVHVGYALSVIDPEEAQKTLALFDEMQAAGALAAVTS
ncbi:HypC/HybG/HupF family hydrogenase formation chaperone [Magnetovibrio blakemorei]|uniref:Hydrogenase maturation factor HypC n=1 Tax=Magnetovibrio blakemorei TaxID=28181 RepID=A0A1E5Q565_9PROT|nr:HypC/HybG/HupF family hydrogenase formation chaperone [Magnetovibrio blakemorei]OEJ65341.1 hypothetical protein BEN30_14580 [Magnetovibrio blakemorei]